MTLHDFHFCIWKEDIPVPIFDSSILQQAQITCGGFSPSRHGIVIIGRSDGKLDIWDFLDTSYKPTIQFTMVSQAISFLRFSESLPNNLVAKALLLLPLGCRRYRRTGAHSGAAIHSLEENQ